jgi:hypothetical protein
MLKPKALGLIVKRQARDRDYDWFLVANGLVIDGVFSIDSKGRETIFPLYAAGADGQQGWFEAKTNLAPKFVAKFQHLLRSEPTPEDIFHYIYAVFHSPGYRSRYAEFLKIDFPRLPLTGNIELFRALAALGGELVSLHLLESPEFASSITRFTGASRTVGKVGWTPDKGGTIWIDGKGTSKVFQSGASGFQPVSEAVWNFHIGGYQVCEKWLKDRKGRTLTDDDITHYHKIVIALTETIRIMSEIDEVINQHGGWPSAFQTNQSI